MQRYDTYCGIYCGACEVINAIPDEEKKRVISLFENKVPNWHATPKQIKCSGCKPDDVFVNCAMCPIRPCAQSKGVDFCMDCAEFPCQIYTFLEMGSDQIPVLKHLKENIKNLEFIKDNGLEKWLADQENKWRCPQCGARFAWYMEKCKSCDHDLNGIKCEN